LKRAKVGLTSTIKDAELMLTRVFMDTVYPVRNVVSDKCGQDCLAEHTATADFNDIESRTP